VSNAEAVARYRARNLEMVNARARDGMRLWRAVHGEDARARRLAYTQRIDAMKRASGCADCGTSEGDLHFHHLDPTTKRFTINKGHGYSETSLQAEIAKCEIVCKPCHHERHRQMGH